MANFDDQVMGLTGLTVSGSSTAPSQTELSTFLNDGVIDVTSKWLIGHPEDRDQFTRVSTEFTSNPSSVDFNGAEIISIVRESGINDDWRPCRKISPALQSQVTDTDSLSFVSKYHPVYMIVEDGKLSVFPAPGASPDRYKIYYVNEVPQNASATQLTYAHSNLGHFPDNKLYLVTLYASVKTLEVAAANQTIQQDIELQASYSQLAGTLKGEYMAAFQIQQPQQGAPPRR